MLSQIFWTIQNDKYASGEFWQLFKPCSSSSGRMSAPIDHSYCRNLCEILCRDQSLWAHVFPLFSSIRNHRVSSGQNTAFFVLTGFITDNIVCSSLLIVHIKPLGSRHAVFVLLCFSFYLSISYWQTWFALSRRRGTKCWNSLQTQKLLLTTFWTSV